MLRLLLKPSLPGGLSFLEALGAGLAAGQDPSMQPDSVVNIEPTSNLFKSNITITPRTQGSLLSGQEVVQIGLKQALLMPKAAAGLVHRIPPTAYAMYEPIKNLGDFVSSPFRRGTLPRITGQEGQPTLGELIQDALAGARVPVGMPPNPLGPQGSVGAIAALLLKGLIPWGQINGPEREETDIPALPNLAQLSYVKGGETSDGRDTAIGTVQYGIGPSGGGFSGGISVGPFTSPRSDGWEPIPGSLEWYLPYNPTSGPHGPGYFGLKISWKKPDGTIVTGYDNISLPGYFPTSLWALRFITYNPPAGSTLIQVNQPSSGIEPWLGADAAEIEPASLEEEGQPALVPPAPLILPLSPDPVPGSTPVDPEPAALPDTPGSPSRPATPAPVITPTLPRPFAPPWIQPNTPTAPGSVPGQFPSNPTQPTQPTAPDGTVTPTQPGPVTQTQPGSVVPWPGAPSIPAIGPAPRPDLQGIAQEVGRIERKIDLMNTPGSGQNGFENLSELLGLLGQIWEFLTASTSGTTYTLDSPCEVDEEGVKLPPIEIEAPGAATTFEALLNRTDALAELIQAHKNLKQPGCKHKLAGEIVTVNFQQIE
jgi:hypothetical protein